jgi:hypothetical protein
MKFFHRMSLLAALLAVPAIAQASPLTVVHVAAPAINCVFNTTCTIVVNDSVGNFTLSGDSGNGRLQSRTFVGGAGAPAQGMNGYDYRIDMTAMHGVTTANCIGTLKINYGPALTYNYKPGTPSQVYVVTSGGLGSVGPSSATLTGTVVTFNFATPVCPGQTSYFFGLASHNGPAATNAQMMPTPGSTPVTVAARAPAP